MSDAGVAVTAAVLSSRAFRPGSRPMIEPVKFATYLEAQAAEIPGVRNSKRSRLKLLAALARLLEHAEFKDIKVQDITADAGLAKGTFFVQFKTKEDVAQELLSRFVEFERATVPEVPLDGDMYDIVYGVVQWYESNFAVNHGVLCCLIRFSGADAQYKQLWRDRNVAMLERWTTAMLAYLRIEAEHLPMFREMVHSAGAIMDQSLFERYGLTAASGGALAQEALVEMHAVLIYRVISGSEPPAERLRHMKPLVGLLGR